VQIHSGHEQGTGATGELVGLLEFEQGSQNGNGGHVGDIPGEFVGVLEVEIGVKVVVGAFVQSQGTIGGHVKDGLALGAKEGLWLFQQ